MALLNFDIDYNDPKSQPTILTGRVVDPIAEAMEVPFERYDAHRLYRYFCAWYQRVFERDYDQFRSKDMNNIQGFIAHYGPDMAGRIVQRLFVYYDGKYDGKHMSVEMLSRPWRWLQDHMEQEIRTLPPVSELDGDTFSAMMQRRRAAGVS